MCQCNLHCQRPGQHLVLLIRDNVLLFASFVHRNLVLCIKHKNYFIIIKGLFGECEQVKQGALNLPDLPSGTTGIASNYVIFLLNVFPCYVFTM